MIIEPPFLKQMQHEAKTSLLVETLTNVHRTKTFAFNVAPTRNSPFWIRSWSYTDEGKAHNCWENFPLELSGVQFEPNMKLVPFISKFVKETGPYKVAGLSLLPPGCRIEPHQDNQHTNIVCHIPLLTNKSSKLVVDGEQKSLEIPGKMICFDDSVEHSSFNNGTTDRVTLYLQK